MDIKRRNGSIVAYNAERIVKAVTKAYEACLEPTDPECLKTILNHIEEHSLPKAQKENTLVTVEDIQEVISDVLLDFNKKVGKAFLRYRAHHAVARQEFDPINLIEEYLERSNDMAEKENASMSFSLQGLHNRLFSSMTEAYWLKILPTKVQHLHNTGRLHMHDLGVLAVYCMGWDLEDLLIKGFTGVPTKTNASPPKHLSSAMGQMVNFLFSLQGEAAGAMAFSNVNTLLAPFVRHDNVSQERLTQQMQEHIFNLNVATRVGGQAPFTNYTFDLDVTKTPMANKYVIIGGKMQNTQYKDYQKEASMVLQAFVDIMHQGDGKGAPFPYPIPTLNVTKDFPWETPLGRSILKSSTKYGTYYFANYINSKYTASDITSMCCRLSISREDIHKHTQTVLKKNSEEGLKDTDLQETHQKGGGFFGAAPKTGSIGVGTISFPAAVWDAFLRTTHRDLNSQFNLDLITEAMKDEKIRQDTTRTFLDILKERMRIVMDALTIRRKVIERLMVAGLYPYSKFYLEDIYKQFKQYFAQHFSTIGVNGMHEALPLLGFDRGMLNEEGPKFTGEVLQMMKDYTVELQQEYKVLVNLEQTPAESAGVKLLRKSGIDPENKGYYTNSTQFPAEADLDLFETVITQGKLNTNYTGGSVLHIYTNENLKGRYRELGALITKACSISELPYFTFSKSFSTCITTGCAGYAPGNEDTCPICGSSMIFHERIVGYYRPVVNWNDGRKKEQARRRYFDTGL